MPTFTKHLNTDYTPDPTGVVSSSPAFVSEGFRDDAVAWQNLGNVGQARLDIDAGTYYMTAGAEVMITRGIKDCLYVGADRDTTILTGKGSQGFVIGAFGQREDGIGHSVRIRTANSGTTTLEAIDTDDLEKLQEVDNPVVALTCLDLQGDGSPANTHLCEYPQVSSLASWPFIELTASIRDTYLETYPLYNAGSGGQPDHGGPATLFVVDPAIDCVQEFQNLTFDPGAAQTYARCVSVTFRNCLLLGTAAFSPSQSKNTYYYDSEVPDADVEIDKLCELLYAENTLFNTLNFQSSAANLLHLVDTTVTTKIEGLPKNALIEGGTIESLGIGAHSYGKTYSLTVQSSVNGPAIINEIHTKGVGTAVNLTESGFTMSGGIIIIPNTYHLPQPWAIPGLCLWSGFNFADGSFSILSVERDGDGNTLVTTDQEGTWPDIPNSGTITIRVHPCPDVTFDEDVTGCEWADALAKAPPHKPLGSYWEQEYVSPVQGSSVNGRVFGYIERIIFNVTEAGTGTFRFCEFNNAIVHGADGTTISDFGPVVDMTQTGIRIMEPGSTTGKVGSDSRMDIPSTGYWFANPQSRPSFKDAGASGKVTMIIQTRHDVAVIGPNIRTFTCNFS